MAICASTSLPLHSRSATDVTPYTTPHMPLHLHLIRHSRCPYTPPHPLNVDFPHLILRYRAAGARFGNITTTTTTTAPPPLSFSTTVSQFLKSFTTHRVTPCFSVRDSNLSAGQSCVGVTGPGESASSGLGGRCCVGLVALPAFLLTNTPQCRWNGNGGNRRPRIAHCIEKPFKQCGPLIHRLKAFRCCPPALSTAELVIEHIQSD